MGSRQQYTKKPGHVVVAVQLGVDTEGFNYHKWGAEQHCKSGDWIVNNEGDIYTVDQEVFSKTYRKIGPGTYAKTTAVWAEVANNSGTVVTKEGTSHYETGDYLVYNHEDSTDAYCISAAKFKSMYELAK